MLIQTCPECGTQLIDVNICKEYLDRMLEWDFMDFAGVGQVHHLTVLCYYLQHPSHYSVQGLKNAIQILIKVIENNLANKKLYQEESNAFSSSNRTWSVTSTPTSIGKYSSKIKWEITVYSVIKNGINPYPEHVKEWAKAIYADLKKADEFA